MTFNEDGHAYYIPIAMYALDTSLKIGIDGPKQYNETSRRKKIFALWPTKVFFTGIMAYVREF